MTTRSPSPAAGAPPAPPAARLSATDRLLPVWIGSAMAAGLLLGRLVPAVADWLDAVKIGQTSLPIAVGLLAMMYPVLAKVRYTLGPVALYGLLFTVIVLFALQGETITARPWDVARIALPLLVYFAIMWFGGYATGRWLHLTYSRTTALAFSAASNDFELAIAVAIGVFGATSGQALAGVVGPLIEVPVLVTLVYLALWLRHRLYPDEEVIA